MPLPKNRSTSVRKVHVRTPRGGHAIHYSRVVKGKSQHCALCWCYLPGASKGKTPNRKFGGHLCTSCSSSVIVAAQRVKDGGIKISDVDILMLPYVKALKLK